MTGTAPHRTLEPSVGLLPVVVVAGYCLLTGCVSSPDSRAPSVLNADAYEALLSGRNAVASRLFAREAARKHRSAELYAAAAICARQADLMKDAIAYRKLAARADPRDPWHKLQLARLLLTESRFAEALEALGTPSDAWGWLTRAQALRRLGKDSESLESLNVAARLDPVISVTQQLRGEILAGRGRLEDAALAYRAAVSIDRSLAHLQVRLASLESAMGKDDSAYELLTSYLLVDPTHSQAKAEKERLARHKPRLAQTERQEEDKRVRRWQSARCPSLTPLPSSPLRRLDVGIVRRVSSFRVKFSSTVTIGTLENNPLIAGPQIEIVGEVTPSGLQVSCSGTHVLTSTAVRFRSRDDTLAFMVFDVHFAKGFHWSDRETRTFRGRLSVSPRDGSLELINHIPLEEYLLGVIPSEMPHAWPLEALKAQAVAARTEALVKLRRHREDGFDICASQHCAVYRGFGGEREKTTRAVRATRGEVLKLGKRLVDTVYAGNCGGWGSSPSAIWRGERGEQDGVCDLPPKLAKVWSRVPLNPDVRERFIYSRPAAYCGHNPTSSSFRWTRCYSAPELEAIVNRRYPVGSLQSVGVGARTAEGWITTIEVIGSAGTRAVKKDAIRGALGTIRSNYFSVEKIPGVAGIPDQYVIHGAGWGHGAGLCQDGARGLAGKNRSHTRILAHYFPRARIRRLY